MSSVLQMGLYAWPGTLSTDWRGGEVFLYVYLGCFGNCVFLTTADGAKPNWIISTSTMLEYSNNENI